MLLAEIVANKHREVAALKAHFHVEKVAKACQALPAPRDFSRPFGRGKFALIAEIKQSSPSAGIIVNKFEPVFLAKQYEEAGAGALSVLTDAQYFGGKLNHLKEVKDPTTIPVLRKDFIIDAAQIYESRVAGADAILLIVRLLSDAQLAEYLDLARELQLSCLVEAHDEREVERALHSSAEIIGLNNRDLDTLQVDLQTSHRLLDKYPELKARIVISESGIKTGEEAASLREKGVSGLLVGESILRSGDIAAKIEELLG
jgi:indole-3-glycerol phosphate synthase